MPLLLRRAALCLLVVLAAGSILLWRCLGPSRANVTYPAQPAAESAHVATQAATHPGEPINKHASSGTPSPEAAIPLATLEEQILDWAASGTAENATKLCALLTHDRADVRIAALDGLERMGLASAAPALREAAGKVNDPREAIRMLDLADYLELPSASSSGREGKTGSLKHRGAAPARQPIRIP